MVVSKIELYDIVRMKKDHPCGHNNKLFQIMRVGADVKIKCLACGNVMMIDRDSFNNSLREVYRHESGPVDLIGTK